MKIILLLGILFSALPAPAPSEDQHVDDAHKVLVLHSYHPGYPWTDDIQRAVVDTLGDRADVELYVEYLDLIRNPGQDHRNVLSDLLRQKYSRTNIEIDVILVSDDSGLDLALKHREDLFAEIPIVFSGVNDFSLDRLKERSQVLGVTGMDDATAIGETIDLAFELKPDLNRIAVVSGARPSEVLQYQSFVEAMETRHPSVNVAHLNALDERQLLDQLAQFGDETVIIYLSYLLSPSGNSYTYRDALQLVVRNAETMVLVTTDFLVRDGVVGGRVVDGYAQGRVASRIVLRILDREAPSSIPIQHQSETRYVFDDRALARHGIPDEDLPDRSVLINRRPDRLIELHREDGLGLFAQEELFDSHGAVMLLIDADGGTIIAANDAAYEFYGYSALVGKNINTINTLSAEETAEEMRSAELQRNNSFSFRHRLADESVRDVAVYSYPLRVEETNILFSVVFDRTEQLEAERSQQQQTEVIFGILALLLVSAATAVVLLLKLLSRRKSAENAIRKHLTVRNALMLEVQHRTKNNMQVIMGLISLQATFMEDEKIAEACERLRGRVSTIALAHHQISSDKSVSYVNMANYVHGVVDGVFAEFVTGGAPPKCFVEISDIEILIDIAVPCGLIVHELVTSSLRRLDLSDTEQKIHLQLSEVDAYTLKLTYSDTVPVPSEAVSHDSEGQLSTILIQELAEHQLGGSFSQDLSSSSGTRSIIHISQSAYKDRIPYENIDS